jgi:hypothetical protein
VGDTNEMWDIFVHDRVTGATTRVGVSSAGEQGNYDSCNPSISSDGQCVAFGSDASNLVAGDTNGTTDVFVDDRGVVAGSDSTAPHTDSDRVAYYANTATILLTASDNEGGSGVAHTYYILGGASQVESSTVRVTSTGAYTLSFWSVDASGNNEAPHTVTFTIIKPPPSSGTPSTPASIATLRHGRSFTVSGYVVKHTAGTSPVTLQFYRYQSGHWVLKKTTTAKVSTILTFSKYSDSTSVPYAGKWRVRARHKVGSHYHYSGYRTFSAS